MTVATESIFVTFEGDDIAVTFPFTFPVYDEDHLIVYLQDTTTEILVVVNAADYSVTGIGNENGGTVVMDTAPSSDNNLIISRQLDITQDLDVLNQGGFYPQNVEAELDLQVMQTQQVDQEVNRSVRGTLPEAWPELPPPPQRRGKLLSFIDDATAYPTIDSADALVAMLANILQAGFGISITVGDGIITITNTAPGGEFEEPDCWLLESAVGGGGGEDVTAEFVRDIVGSTLQGLGCVIVVDDGTDTVTVDLTQDATAEVVRDVMGVALVAGSGITITPNDGADTITIAATGGVDGFQPLSDTLTGIADAGPAAVNDVPFATGVDTFDFMTVSPFSRTLFDETSAGAWLTALGAIAGGTGTFSNNTLSLELPLATGGTLLVQGGTGTQAADSNGTVTFPTPYGTFAPVVVVSGGLSNHTQEGDAHIVGNPSTTGFTVGNSAGGGTVTYNWIALGRKL